MTSLLEIAQAQLDRTQAFFPRIDGKLTGLLALALGQVAILAINLKPDDLALWYVDVLGVVFGLLIVVAGVHLFFCAAPSLKGGGEHSLYYFDSIARKTETEYVTAFTGQAEEERVKDALGQVWRNSEIVAAKFNHLSWATMLIVGAAAPWAALILSVSLAHHQMPVVKGG